MEIDDSKPWDQEAEEPEAWFDRFERFRLAGPSRSLLAVYNAERAAKEQPPARDIPGAWKENAVEWRWRTRAKAWDLGEMLRRRKEYDAEREQDRKDRIALLKHTRDRLKLALDSATTENVPLKDILAGIRMVTQALRAEYVDLPFEELDWENLSDDELRAVSQG